MWRDRGVWGRLRNIPLYYRTYRHYRPSQIGWKIWLSFKRRFHRRFLTERLHARGTQGLDVSGAVILKGAEECGDYPVCREVLDALHRRSEQVLTNRFVFLNRAVDFPHGIQWEENGQSVLWNYNLHYFDYLADLGILHLLTGKPELYLKFRELVTCWIHQNPVGYGMGWREAYVPAVRVSNWVFVYHCFQRRIEQDAHFKRLFLDSLNAQLLFIERNIEWHIPGNHLVKDGRALLFGGLFFTGKRASKWFAQGLDILWQALREQVLDDGGHFERSFMYHAIVLQDYLESVSALQNGGFEVPEWVREKIKNMLLFLAETLHPDEKIPLFNDAALGGGRRPSELLALGAALLEGGSRYGDSAGGLPLYAFLWSGLDGKRRFEEHASVETGRESKSFPESGYFVMQDRTNGKYLIVDCGAIAPDHLPAHGHSDILSYELSLDSSRIIVDSGTYTYEADRWRSYFRSALAHNGLMVESQDPCEMWGKFRVGGRPYPAQTIWSREDGSVCFIGMYRGWGRFTDIVIRRKIVFVEDTFWMFSDEVLPSDVLDEEGDVRERNRAAESSYSGSRSYLLESFIHLHPDVRILHDDGVVRIVAPTGSALWIRQMDGDQIDEGQGWYSDEFGKKVPNPVLCLKKKGRLPLVARYVLSSVEIDDLAFDFSDWASRPLSLSWP